MLIRLKAGNVLSMICCTTLRQKAAAGAKSGSPSVARETAMAGIPCNVEVASEYRYRETVPDPQTLVVTL